MHTITYTGLLGLESNECIVVKTNSDLYMTIIQESFKKGFLNVSHLISIALLNVDNDDEYFMITIKPIHKEETK